MSSSSSVKASGVGREPWWDKSFLLLALVLGSAIPLLYPPVPPLVDLMGHMGRYRVELDLAQSEWLQLYYSYRWAAIGNLGVDLLVRALGPLIGLEPAVKLIVLAIPPLTVAGFLWVAREVHGRIPPTSLFAIPFVYGHPFLFGFVNFTLSMALAFLAFALWLRLGRTGRTRLRAMLFDVVKKAAGREDCALCEITYGPLGKKDAWRSCEARLGLLVDELHRDRLPPEWGVDRRELPCVLARSGRETPFVLVTRDEIVACRGSIDGLERTIAQSLASIGGGR